MENVEEKIKNVAIELFANKGYAATSIRDIANEVGITSATLYYYMKNKQELLHSIMIQYLTQLRDEALKELSQISSDSPIEELETLIKYHVRSHGLRQLAARVVDNEYRALEGDDKEEIKQLRKEYEVIWVNVLGRGLKQKTFTFNSSKLTSFALIGLCTGVAQWYKEEGELSIEDISEHYAKLGIKMVTQ